MTFDISKISTLGFGCMRFIGREDNTIDIANTEQMVDRFLEAGGTYFDTAWAYPNSEAALGKALVARHPRDSYLIASKCVAWTHCDGPEDLERQLQETLENLGCGYLDVYLMHNLGMAKWYASKFADYLAENADKPETFEYPKTERLVTEDGQHFYDS